MFIILLYFRSGSSGTITYTNLPSATYKFRAMADLVDGSEIAVEREFRPGLPPKWPFSFISLWIYINSTLTFSYFLLSQTTWQSAMCIWLMMASPCLEAVQSLSSLPPEISPSANLLMRISRIVRYEQCVCVHICTLYVGIYVCV